MNTVVGRPQETPSRSASSAPAAVSAVGLSKTYHSAGRQVDAVRGLDLHVAEGQFYGLLGTNGAGKSTTLGMLTTLIRPTAGSAQILGRDVARSGQSIRRQIGVVSQRNTLDRKLDAAENLEFRARYFGARPRAARQRATEILQMLDLAHVGSAHVDELSGGETRRLMVGRALVHRPRLLFLDEPTAGTDVAGRIALWRLVSDMNDDGMTVILTTHYLEEAEALCDRLAIIDSGQIMAVGSVAELASMAAAETMVEVTFDGDVPPLDDIGRQPRVSRMSVHDSTVAVFGIDIDDLLGQVIGRADGRIVAAQVRRPRLEDVFLRLTAGGA